MNKIKVLLYISFFVITSAIITIKIDNYTFIYLLSFWLVVLAIYIAYINIENRKLIAIYLGSIVLSFLLAEIYFSGLFSFSNANSSSELNIVQGSTYIEHPLLGYTPGPNSEWNRKAFKRDSVIYNVTQTTNENRLRVIPGTTSNESKPVMFFGCSFTFGAGLNDYETLPYYFQSKSDGKIQSINMAYDGYGAHQMLTILKHQMDEKVLNEQVPLFGIYSGITDHVFRGSGQSMEIKSQLYEINAKGELINKISAYKPTTFSRIYYLLLKSYLLRRFLQNRLPAKEQDIDLMVATIESSAAIFTKRYNAPFYCLLWNETCSEKGLYDKIFTRLQSKGISVIEIQNILPDYKENPSLYDLGDDDHHPNALANQIIADYLVKNLLK